MSQLLYAPVPMIRSEAPALGLAERALAGIASAAATLAREWRLRGDRRALATLDARILADIGIGPGQEEGAVRHGRRALSRVPMAVPRSGAARPMPASWTEWR